MTVSATPPGRTGEKLARNLKPIYTAPAEAAAAAGFEEFTDTWAARYLAIIKLWCSAWSEFVPFLDYDVEIREIICTTNAIESLNALPPSGAPGDTSPALAPLPGDNRRSEC